MAIEWVIPGRLVRSSRPGFGGTNPAEVDPAEVEAWLDEARVQGIRSLLCLLDEPQLPYCAPPPGADGAGATIPRETSCEGHDQSGAGVDAVGGDRRRAARVRRAGGLDIGQGPSRLYGTDQGTT